VTRFAGVKSEVLVDRLALSFSEECCGRFKRLGFAKGKLPAKKGIVSAK
jgi:hypothetical protein